MCTATANFPARRPPAAASLHRGAAKIMAARAFSFVILKRPCVIIPPPRSPNISLLPSFIFLRCRPRAHFLPLPLLVLSRSLLCICQAAKYGVHFNGMICCRRVICHQKLNDGMRALSAADELCSEVKGPCCGSSPRHKHGPQVARSSLLLRLAMWSH